MRWDLGIFISRMRTERLPLFYGESASTQAITPSITGTASLWTFSLKANGSETVQLSQNAVKNEHFVFLTKYLREGQVLGALAKVTPPTPPS